MSRVFYSKGLSDIIRAQIRDLDSACSKFEPLCMKLNWDMLESRLPDEVNDLLWYEDGRLVGFLGLYGFGAHPVEIELTGIVDPDYRRQGIFSRLFSAGIDICRSRGAGRLLLIVERQSVAGAGFAGSAGLSFDFSEYRMICNEYRAPASTPPGFMLRPAGAGDTAFLKNLDELCFGRTYSDDNAREIEHVSVAVLDGRAVGKIGLNYEDGLGYVFGVCMHPEYRGRGYGRAMLDGVLKKHFETATMPAILEVAVKNDGALTLYKSCGFSELTIYDYFELKLSGGTERKGI